MIKMDKLEDIIVLLGIVSGLFLISGYECQKYRPMAEVLYEKPEQSLKSKTKEKEGKNDKKESKKA